MDGYCSCDYFDNILNLIIKNYGLAIYHFYKYIDCYAKSCILSIATVNHSIKKKRNMYWRLKSIFLECIGAFTNTLQRIFHCKLNSCAPLKQQKTKHNKTKRIQKNSWHNGAGCFVAVSTSIPLPWYSLLNTANTSIRIIIFFLFFLIKILMDITSHAYVHLSHTPNTTSQTQYE